MQFPIRINKYLRDKGIASRKDADKLVNAGLVFVNGNRANLGLLVQEADRIEVVKSVREKKYIYLAYCKPRGFATQGPEGTPSVIGEWAQKGLFPVGRLDKESEGLLILTNDGRVSTAVLGGESKFEKEYVVRVKETLRAGIPAIFKKGMQTKTFGALKPAGAEILDDQTLSVILREGKRHQIRVMLDELGYTIERLKRVRVGKILLGNLKPGQTRELEKKELADLFPAQKG